MKNDKSSHCRLVNRLLMLDHLNLALGFRLTLLVAPEGYGKSFLLHEWTSGLSCKTAWVSLTARDNDPTQFLSDLVQSLISIEAEIGVIVRPDSEEAQQSQINDRIVSVINVLTTVPCDFVLVLDNYHIINTPPVHQFVELMLDFSPALLHLVISTQTLPPLPLPRLRVRRQLLLLELDRPLH